jgi:hypothetical protein
MRSVEVAADDVVDVVAVLDRLVPAVRAVLVLGVVVVAGVVGRAGVGVGVADRDGAHVVLLMRRREPWSRLVAAIVSRTGMSTYRPYRMIRGHP